MPGRSDNNHGADRYIITMQVASARAHKERSLNTSLRKEGHARRSLRA